MTSPYDSNSAQVVVDGEEVLLCPSCGDFYLHQHSVSVFDREEDSDTGRRTVVNGSSVLVDEEMKDNPSRRRQGLSIDFLCEFGCTATLAIFQHKGCTEIRWMNVSGGCATDAEHTT